MKYARIGLKSDFIAGLHTNKISFSKYTLDKKSKIEIGLLSYYRTKGENYMLYPEYWDVNKFNNRIDLSLKHKYNFNEIKLNLIKLNELKFMADIIKPDPNPDISNP